MKQRILRPLAFATPLFLMTVGCGRILTDSEELACGDVELPTKAEREEAVSK